MKSKYTDSLRTRASFLQTEINRDTFLRIYAEIRPEIFTPEICEEAFTMCGILSPFPPLVQYVPVLHPVRALRKIREVSEQLIRSGVPWTLALYEQVLQAF